MKQSFPREIQSFIENKEYTIDDIGRSDSQVLLFEDMVLKIQGISPQTKKEAEMILWLQDKLPVPKLLAYVEANEKSYLLMSKVEGKMSCAKEYLENPETLVNALAKGLKMLWSVDISECPQETSLEEQLKKAQYRVKHQMVDMEDAEDSTYGEGGFEDPEELLNWLITHQPDCEPVLSHGDYCLPNIFLKQDKIVGFIDLGRCGIADKWCDIALCYRSLIHNFDGTYGGKVYPDFCPNILFEKLGIEPNWEKIRYYILLDELF